MAAAKMTEDEYWAWYAATTGREGMYTAEAKVHEPVPVEKTHLTLVGQIEQAKNIEDALVLCKQHDTTLPFVGAVEVVYSLAKKNRWKKSHGSFVATGVVDKLAKKVAHGLDPAKLTPAVACKALYALGKYGMLNLSDVKAFQKHAEEIWNVKAIEATHAAHFVWSVVKLNVKLEHACRMAFIDTIRHGCVRLSHADMAEITWAIQKGAMTVDGTVRRTPQEDALFEAIAQRLMAEVDSIDPEFLVDIIHNFASLGLKHEKLLKALCPKLLAAKLNEQLMANCIKAYTRFSVPFRESSQGYRQTAVVVKGDYQRPSDKPHRKKRKYDKPTAITWG